MKSGITITKTQGKGLPKNLKALLEKSDVLVGIPQDRNNRPGEPIGNAALLYIHTNGSPIRNIPARPVIEPALAEEQTRKAINVELNAAVKAMISNEPEKAFNFLERAGTIGANAAKAWFFNPSNNWQPLKPATIKHKGSSQPLIDTGSMRKAITHVVRTEK